MVNPCYLCPRRTPGCHGKCEDYQAWSKARQEENERNRRGSELVDDVEFKRRMKNTYGTRRKR